MTNPEEKLKRAIEGTGVAQVIQVASNVDGDKLPEIKKIAIQSRIAREDVPKWLSIIDFVLQEEEEQDSEDNKWSAHCCKTYVRHEGNLGFVWNVTISSRNDIKRAVTDVSRAIRTLSSSLKSIPASVAPFGQQKTNGGAIKRAAAAIHSTNVSNLGREPILSVIGNRVEVSEMPLIGVTEDRNKPDGPGSKGARFIAGG